MLQHSVSALLLFSSLLFPFRGAARQPAPAQDQGGKPSAQKASEAETIRIDTALVTLSVGVFDQKGRQVDNLTQENFEVYEDGQRQAIAFFSPADEPVSFGLLLDSSQSMGETGKLQNAKAVALAFLRAGNPKNEAFCLSFNDSSRLISDFTADYQKIASSLDQLEAGGGTAVYDAILAGLERLGRGRHRRRALLVITDGVDQHSQHSAAAVLQRARQADAQIYTVAFFSPVEAEVFKAGGPKVMLVDGSEVDNPQFVFKTLAEETGAEAFFPRSAQELNQIMAQIAASLRRQYTLAYYPPNQSGDARYRQIRVRLTGSGTRGWQVKTRRGYALSATGNNDAQAAGASARSENPLARLANESKPRASLSAPEQPGPEIYRETFDDPSTGWPNTEKSFYQKGRYHVLGQRVVPVANYVYRDFEASVSVEMLTGPENAGERSFGGLAGVTDVGTLPSVGFSFRVNPEGYYTFLIAPTPTGQYGFYTLTKVAAGQQTTLISWKRDQAIRFRNRLTVRCRGPQIELAINGLRVMELRDAAHRTGSLSLTLASGHAVFDDVLIKRIE